MASDIGEKLIGILAPSFGNAVAKAKVIAACHLGGTDIEIVKKADLPPVAGRLEQLCQSLGPKVATSIKERALAL